MKRRVIFVMILALVCICSAQADAYKDVNKYISQGLSDQNILKIKELSPQLTQKEKDSIYTWKKVSPLAGAGFNLVAGFGAGSFSQGDGLHGTLFLIGDAICTGLIIYDIVKHGVDEFNHSLFGGDAAGDMKLALIGLIGGAGLRIWQTVHPFIYAKKYNAKLRDALGMDGTTVALLPAFNREGGLGMTFAARIPLD